MGGEEVKINQNVGSEIYKCKCTVHRWKRVRKRTYARLRECNSLKK